MLFDRIENLDKLQSAFPALARIRAFLESHPTLDDGRCELGEGIYANVSHNILRDAGVFEVHRRYADLQLVLEGSEIIQWASLKDLTQGTEYDAEKDAQFFDCAPVCTATLKMDPGFFALFWPQDGHKPLLRMSGNDKNRKIVFKIPV